MTIPLMAEAGYFSSVDDTIKVAVIGCGHWGKNLARNFSELGVLAAICDPSPAARELAARLPGDVFVGGDLDEALARDVDAVVIATPSATHFRRLPRIRRSSHG